MKCNKATELEESAATGTLEAQLVVDAALHCPVPSGAPAELQDYCLSRIGLGPSWRTQRVEVITASAIVALPG